MIYFTIQPIDEYGRIGFDDHRGDGVQAENFSEFEEAVETLIAEGFDALDVTVTVSDR